MAYCSSPKEYEYKTGRKFSSQGPRACLKIHSRHLHAPLCGIFAPNSLAVAHYAAFIWGKSPTKWNAHLAESNFQTRSSIHRTGSLRGMVKSGFWPKGADVVRHGNYIYLQ